EQLAGIPALAQDKVPEVARVLRLVVRLELLGASPVAYGVAHRVPEIGCQPALPDVEHLVPAPGLVEPERRPRRGRRERVLELVAVVELLDGRDDRLERRLPHSAEPAQRVLDLRRLRGDL